MAQAISKSKNGDNHHRNEAAANISTLMAKSAWRIKIGVSAS